MLGLAPNVKILSLILDDFARKNSLIGVAIKLNLNKFINILLAMLLSLRKRICKIGYLIFDDSFIELRVSDTGLGIFGRRYRIDFQSICSNRKQTTVSSSGSGLGYPFVKV
jgi:hypothetical protein